MGAVDVNSLLAEIAHDEAELLATRAAVERLDSRLQDRRAMLTLAERVYGPTDAPGISQAPHSSASTAIASPGTMVMLQEIIKTGGLWDPQALLVKLSERGWTTNSTKPISVISGALGRLVQTDPDVEKVGQRQYRWRSDVMERISDA